MKGMPYKNNSIGKEEGRKDVAGNRKKIPGFPPAFITGGIREGNKKMGNQPCSSETF
jgi:hypothetical protein